MSTSPVSYCWATAGNRPCVVALEPGRDRRVEVGRAGGSGHAAILPRAPEPSTGQDGDVTWTSADIPDLTGRTAVVTGANCGIGFRAALELARHGAAVTLAARDPGRGAGALARLRAEVPGADVALARWTWPTWRRCGPSPPGTDRPARPAGQQRRGDGACRAAAPPDGFERQFGTNHLGHFALTGLLLPALLARARRRGWSPSPAGCTRSAGSTSPTCTASAATASGRRTPSPSWRTCCSRSSCSGGRTRPAWTCCSVAAHPGYAATNLQAAGPRLAGRRVDGAGDGRGDPGRRAVGPGRRAADAAGGHRPGGTRRRGVRAGRPAGAARRAEAGRR